MTFGCDFWLELAIGIRDWDYGLRLGIGMGVRLEIGNWDWGFGLRIGVTFGCDFWF